MQCSLSTQIGSLLKGSSVLGPSSRSLGWNGFTVESYAIPAGKKPETRLKQDFIAVWTGAPSSGKYKNLDGSFKAFSIQAGDVTLFPIGLIPEIHLAVSTEIAVVAFELDFMKALKPELGRPSPHSFHAHFVLPEPRLSTLVILLMTECISGGLNGRGYADSLAHAIAGRFLHLGEMDRQRQEIYAHGLASRSICRVLDRMHAEFDSDLTLNALAAESGYCRRHFMRIFEQATGYTPHQYLLQLRMQRATELLRKTSTALIDVAAYSGFSSQSHMSEVFRKYCGVTPGQIRRDNTRLLPTRGRTNPQVETKQYAKVHNPYRFA
jgi:AraC family transcriptional regulator